MLPSTLPCLVKEDAKLSFAWAGVKNIFRGVALALVATFLGCALFFTVPDAIAAQFDKVLPYWFYESEVSV